MILLIMTKLMTIKIFLMMMMTMVRILVMSNFIRITGKVLLFYQFILSVKADVPLEQKSYVVSIGINGNMAIYL